ncbi:MAG: protein-glutamate O-methyltransferase CheR [Bacillota bacterium]|nr:protein-glutamate O-methyltransferase CheR [Bacillota bacterium]
MKAGVNDLKLTDEDIEIKLMLEGIFLKYGYDFRNYSFAHIKRRVLHKAGMSNISCMSEMMRKVIYDKEFFYEILSEFSINVTEMFRDASFFKALRKEVMPALVTYPFIKIWHAGCSTGEEVYSMAILLKEEGLYDRCQIYATDFNENALGKAKEGIYSADSLKDFELGYKQAGGKGKFSDYYVSKRGALIFDNSLKERIVFAAHNLVTDGAFGEMNIIVCRNVLIYFNKELQNRVIKLFYDSLSYSSFLCLGSKETVKFSKYDDLFDALNEKEKIFVKKIIS